MPSQRKEGKGLVGFFATKEEKAALRAAAKAEGVTVAEWLRRVVLEAKAKRDALTQSPKTSNNEAKPRAKKA